MENTAINLGLFSHNHYLAFVLSEKTRQELIKALGAHFEIRVCHHVTIQYDHPHNSETKVLQNFITATDTVRAVGYYVTGSQVVIKVEIDGKTHKPLSQKTNECLHITYERDRATLDMDSKNVFDAPMHSAFTRLNIVLEGEYRMLPKGGRTPTEVNEAWVQKKIANKPFLDDGWVACGHTQEGNPMAFVLRNKNGPSRTVNVSMDPDSEYQELLTQYKARNSDVMSAHVFKGQSMPTDKHYVAVLFLMPGESGTGWIACGYEGQEEPLYFQHTTEGVFDRTVQVSDDIASDYQMLLESWRLFVAKTCSISNSTVCYHGDHYQGARFNRFGHPLLFRNVKNQFLNYSITNGADVYRKMLELWKIRNGYKSSDYIMNMAEPQKQEITTEGEYKFCSSFLAANNEWVAMEVDSVAVPAYFVFRSEGKPSTVVPRDWKQGTKFMEIYEAWAKWAMDTMYKRHIKMVESVRGINKVKLEEERKSWKVKDAGVPVENVPEGSTEKDMVVNENNTGFTGYSHNRDGFPTVFYVGRLGRPVGYPINNRTDFQKYHRLLTIWCVNNKRTLPKDICWDEFNVVAEPKAEVIQSVDNDGTILIDGVPKCIVDGL